MSDAAERKERLASLFGRAAPSYDDVVPYFATFGRRLVEHVGVGPDEHVLDLGAGRGATTFPAAAAGARVLATDLAPEMVDLLGADVRRRGLTSRVQVRVMDAECPEVPTAAFDAVLAGFVVFFLPDPIAALERYRVALKPGGRLGLTTFAGVDPRWHPVGDVLNSYSPQQGPPPPDLVRSPDALVAALDRTGFTAVTTVTERHEFSFPDLDTWERWSASHGQLAVHESLSPEQRAELRERVGAVFAGFANPDGSIPLWQEVAYVVGVRPA